MKSRQHKLKSGIQQALLPAVMYDEFYSFPIDSDLRNEFDRVSIVSSYDAYLTIKAIDGFEKDDEIVLKNANFVALKPLLDIKESLETTEENVGFAITGFLTVASMLVGLGTQVAPYVIPAVKTVATEHAPFFLKMLSQRKAFNGLAPVLDNAATLLSGLGDPNAVKNTLLRFGVKGAVNFAKSKEKVTIAVKTARGEDTRQSDFDEYEEEMDGGGPEMEDVEEPADDIKEVCNCDPKKENVGGEQVFNGSTTEQYYTNKEK
jgi:hypothetical protein